MNRPTKTVLHNIIETYLNHDSYDLECLSKWIRQRESPTGMEKAKVFKKELREAIAHPGTVTPQLYERWTGEDMDDQEAVQRRLKEVWDTCFGTE